MLKNYVVQGFFVDGLALSVEIRMFIVLDVQYFVL